MELSATAPVKARSEIRIDAPVPEVWNLLVNARDWPAWNPDIKSVSVEGALEEGSRFEWGPAWPRIRSEVKVCVPESMLAWTGSMLHIRAVHVWRLRGEGGAAVLATEESLEGFAVSVLMPARKLEANLAAWLGRFKAHAPIARAKLEAA